MWLTNGSGLSVLKKRSYFWKFSTWNRKFDDIFDIYSPINNCFTFVVFSIVCLRYNTSIGTNSLMENSLKFHLDFINSLPWFIFDSTSCNRFISFFIRTTTFFNLNSFFQVENPTLWLWYNKAQRADEA